jgi:hypothetical protein
MATTEPSRPGVKYGRTSEFTIFLNVKPGHAEQLRETLQRPDFEEKRKEASAAIGTLHDLRWVLFDNDTRLLFATNFDGDWDAYINDFATKSADMFDAVLQHTVDYPGIRDPKIKDFIVAHQVTACAYFRTVPDATVKDIQKALRVQEAFQRLLDEAS